MPQAISDDLRRRRRCRLVSRVRCRSTAGLTRIRMTAIWRCSERQRSALSRRGDRPPRVGVGGGPSKKWRATAGAVWFYSPVGENKS